VTPRQETATTAASTAPLKVTPTDTPINQYTKIATRLRSRLPNCHSDLQPPPNLHTHRSKFKRRHQPPYNHSSSNTSQLTNLKPT
jgi:hypothetical protein